jgi:hypothetical protein
VFYRNILRAIRQSDARSQTKCGKQRGCSFDNGMTANLGPKADLFKWSQIRPYKKLATGTGCAFMPLQRLLAKTRRSVLKSAPWPQRRVAAESGLHSRLQAKNFRAENNINSCL